MDVEMPEAFGDDLTSWLRDQGLAAPVYLISALPDEQLARRAEECGAAGFIPKRLGIDGVLARIQAILGVSGSARSAAPTILVDDFVSMARGRIRRAEGAIERGDPGAAAGELHTLAGEAALIGLAELAARAETARVAATGVVGQTQLAIATTCGAALVSLNAELDAAAHRARVPVAKPAAGASGRLLLLDDSDFYRSTLMTLLEDSGYEVVEARRLADARHRMREGRFDVAILDLRLADGRGTDLIPELREHAPSTRLLLLSGDGASVAGADLQLPKSVDPEDLLRHIRALVSG
jgi:DNA-binding response OmpR family regulator